MDRDYETLLCFDKHNNRKRMQSIFLEKDFVRMQMRSGSILGSYLDTVSRFRNFEHFVCAKSVQNLKMTCNFRIFRRKEKDWRDIFAGYEIAASHAARFFWILKRCRFWVAVDDVEDLLMLLQQRVRFVDFFFGNGNRPALPTLKACLDWDLSSDNGKGRKRISCKATRVTGGSQVVRPIGFSVAPQVFDKVHLLHFDKMDNDHGCCMFS